MSFNNLSNDPGAAPELNPFVESYHKEGPQDGIEILASANLYHIEEGYNISPCFVSEYEPMNIEVTPSVTLPIFDVHEDDTFKNEELSAKIKPEFKTPRIQRTNFNLS